MGHKYTDFFIKRSNWQLCLDFITSKFSQRCYGPKETAKHRLTGLNLVLQNGISGRTRQHNPI